MKIIYYYQTFICLDDLINDPNCVVTHIHLSSIHFGVDSNSKPYIHLNDNNPSDPKFDNLWKDLHRIKGKGIKIILMIGGAGGGYSSFFSDYSVYSEILFNFIDKNKDLIDGIDLDIEEPVSLDNTKKLISDIRKTFGDDFIISLAPIQSSLMNDEPGMSGFIYKDLYTSQEGKYIDYFNVQCYDDFSIDAYQQMLKNGYPENMINMGMLSGMDLTNILTEIKKIRTIYNLAGVFNWEYYSSPPDGQKNPAEWSKLINKTISSENIINENMENMENMEKNQAKNLNSNNDNDNNSNLYTYLKNKIKSLFINLY